MDIATRTRRSAGEGEGAVHADVLRFFSDLVSELGGDSAPMLASAGLDPVRLAAGTEPVTYSQLSTLLEETAAALAVPDLGLRLAVRQRGLAIYGPLGEVMRHSRTFGDALRFVASHVEAHSLGARIWIRLTPDEQMAFVGHDILSGGISRRAQAIEQVLLIGHLGSLELTGGAVRARRVHFRHEALSPIKVYRRLFGCDVAFGKAADGVYFLERDLNTPVIDPDARRYGEAAAYIEAAFGRDRPPFQAQVRGFVMQNLGSGACAKEDVAGELRVHPRTLLRRLRDEGTSFQDIKDEVRRDTILYYIGRTSLDFGDISDRLGFSEQSAMTRFCRKAFGASPTMLRAGQVSGRSIAARRTTRET